MKPLERIVFTKTEDFQAQNALLGGLLPFQEDTSILKEELVIGKHHVRNRLACQAMEGCDGTADGSPDELTLRRYDRFARGGAGLIWFEATAVMREGRANPRQLYLTKDNLDDFKRIVERIKTLGEKEHGTAPVVVMQATHSGRYAKPNGTPAPLIAYQNPIFEKDAAISADRIVTDEYLDRVGEALVEGAYLAECAGFDGVDVKCCHRYLNSELLSAYQREGRYGGDFENRTRLLRESVQGAIARCGKDFLVSTRLNVYDGFPYPYGFGVAEGGGDTPDLSEPDRLLKALSSYGVKLVNLTMGNPYFNPHVNRPFARGAYEVEEHPLQGVVRMLEGIRLLKKQNPSLTVLSSALSYLGVAAPHVAAAYVTEGAFDLAGFGRMIFAYPDFAREIVETGRLDPKKICLCCSKCTEIMRKPGGTPGCVIRDREIYFPLYQSLCMGGQA